MRIYGLQEIKNIAFKADFAALCLYCRLIGGHTEFTIWLHNKLAFFLDLR